MLNGAMRNPVAVVMLKAPRLGFVKTRLAAEVGTEAARAIYQRLVTTQMAELPPEWPVEVHVAPAHAVADVQSWLGPGATYHPQLGDDLGQRLIHAVDGAFARGALGVIVLGGDCPGLDAATLRDAAAALRSADVVLGPALDGGYYLIGLRAPAPELFTGIAWSTAQVLTETLARVRAGGLRHHLLKPLEDVDDLASWQRALMRSDVRDIPLNPVSGAAFPAGPSQPAVSAPPG